MPIPSFRCLSRCCHRAKANEEVEGVANNGFQAVNESPSARSSMASAIHIQCSDDDIRGVRLLWLRNVQRIQIQVTSRERERTEDVPPVD